MLNKKTQEIEEMQQNVKQKEQDVQQKQEEANKMYQEAEQMKKNAQNEITKLETKKNNLVNEAKMKEKIEIARNLLSIGMNIKDISTATGLNKEEIESIIDEKI